MKLMWVKLKGIGRFRNESIVNLSSKLTALVGSNESGKTSIIRAINGLNDDSKIPDEFVHKVGFESADETWVKSRFLLDQEEVSKLGLSGIYRLDVTKPQSGKRELSISPKVSSRDITLRIEMRSELASVLVDGSKLLVEAEGLDPQIKQKWQKLADAAESNDDTLERPQLTNLVNQSIAFLKPNESKEITEELKQFCERLRFFLVDETKPSPNESAISELRAMLPKFLLFTEEHRGLKYEYTPKELRSPHKPLATIASLAGVDLNELAGALEQSDTQKRMMILRPANEKLKGIFQGKWSQSRLELELEEGGGMLRLMLNEGNAQFSELKMRSEGFKQFVSLVAFSSSQKLDNPILLIDEIEQHLHYDGQADLLHMLARQSLVSKVIYSTHSIGSLPEELGGVKVVTRQPDSFISKIENKFWKDGGGFAPLLPKIGATQLAFLPLRRALIVEGAADMLLLPAIIKEVMQRDYVGFLIAHGLSESSSSNLATLSGSGSKVSYLTDSDEGGKTLQKDLIDAGVSEDTIFELPAMNLTKVVLEDLLSAEALSQGFDGYLTSYDVSAAAMSSESEFKGDDKIEVLSNVKKIRGIDQDIKVALAYELLKIKGEDPTFNLVSPQFIEPLKSLIGGIEASLSLD